MDLRSSILNAKRHGRKIDSIEGWIPAVIFLFCYRELVTMEDSLGVITAPILDRYFFFVKYKNPVFYRAASSLAPSLTKVCTVKQFALWIKQQKPNQFTMASFILPFLYSNLFLSLAFVAMFPLLFISAQQEDEVTTEVCSLLKEGFYRKGARERDTQL